MKVVQINSVCGFGSTGRIVKNLSETMNENNIENYVFYGIGSTDYANALKIGNDLGIRIHQLQTRLFGWHGYASCVATKQLIRQLELIKPDIIHLHNIHGFYLNIELLFNYLSKIEKPIFWTLHDCWAFTGHCANFDYIGCQKWINGCGECPQKKAYPVSWFFDRTNKQWKNKKRIFTSIKKMTIVTPSVWLANLVQSSFLKKYPVKVINNGIDTNAFSPKDSNFREKNNLCDKYIVLGIASQWTNKKGLSYFVELSKKLDDNFQIILVGLTNKQKKFIPKNILGIGNINSIDELARLYSIADIFVNPTLEDNFPTVNIEALACGTPVITFDTGGSPEVLNDKCGKVVFEKNTDELLSSIIYIKNKNITKSCCLNRASNFNKKDKFMEYIDLYKKTLQK